MRSLLSSRAHAFAVLSLAILTLGPIPWAGATELSTESPRSGIRLQILSSPAQYVSGGNARIAIHGVPSGAPDLGLWLNGRPTGAALSASGKGTEAVVEGLREGTNLLEVRRLHAPGRPLAALRMRNYPVSGPMFSGAQQQPFICRAEDAGLGQPLADNQQGIGHPVRDAAGRIVGHSRHCAIAARRVYLYFNGAEFLPFDPATDFASPPADLARVDVDGASVPFVIRVEVGSINRFLYTIAMLAPFPEGDVVDLRAWNRKLVYWLRGGVGVGRQQGLPLWFNNTPRGSERRVLAALLAEGRAVVASSGNETRVHYNMRLAEETALMTKEHFIETYGAPRHTIGIGGSGGAVQQYAFAQNRPGLLDAGVAIQSYPDMITQITPGSDCPLLEQYFADEVRRDPASPWKRWSARRLIIGMNASDSAANPLTGTPGSTECIQGWLEPIATVLNPHYRSPEYDDAATRFGYPPEVFERVTWTHWSDLANIYGTDARGYAPDTVDNEGVQYGLRALAAGAIGTDEFLRLNACVGGWKQQHDFVERDRATDPFDARNMLRSASCRDPDGVPAPRRDGSRKAMQRAWTSGHVFSGQRLAMPVIDFRPYLEPLLDMHNSRQGFSVRARLLSANPAAAARQVIWVSDPRADLTAVGLQALAVLEDYLEVGTPPPGFADACFSASGTPLASGPAVWSGILDAGALGACATAFPPFASARMVAGGSIREDLFRCRRKPVARALADGSYGAGVVFSTQQRRWLEKIFAHGVCDYAPRDAHGLSEQAPE